MASEILRFLPWWLQTPSPHHWMSPPWVSPPWTRCCVFLRSLGHPHPCLLWFEWEMFLTDSCPECLCPFGGIMWGGWRTCRRCEDPLAESRLLGTHTPLKVKSGPWFLRKYGFNYGTGPMHKDGRQKLSAPCWLCAVFQHSNTPCTNYYNNISAHGSGSWGLFMVTTGRTRWGLSLPQFLSPITHRTGLELQGFSSHDSVKIYFQAGCSYPPDAAPHSEGSGGVGRVKPRVHWQREYLRHP